MNRVKTSYHFEECGFDIDIIGLQRIVSSGNRWRTSYKQNGVFGLRDTRKENSGRKSERELTLEEKYAFGSGTKLIKS